MASTGPPGPVRSVSGLRSPSRLQGSGTHHTAGWAGGRGGWAGGLSHWEQGQSHLSASRQGTSTGVCSYQNKGQWPTGLLGAHERVFTSPQIRRETNFHITECLQY